jgi:Uma2 family endonuclease
MAVAKKAYITEEQYLEAELASKEKHEYYRGEVFAMAGASIPHNLISSNTLIVLGKQLAGSNCKPIGSDLRIHIPLNTLYTYPDISIICGKFETTDIQKDTVTNPKVIVEIVSESTKDYDRGSKFMLYRDIPSLQEYILIDSTGSVHIEKFARQKDHSWLLTELKTTEEKLTLDSLQIELLVSEIYDGVYTA